FLTWEAFINVQHGQSHFLVNLPQLPLKTWVAYKFSVGKALLPVLGGVTPALALLGLTALCCRRLLIGGVAVLATLGYLAMACFDVPLLSFGESFWLERPLEQAIFGLVGLLLGAILLLIGQRCVAGRAKHVWSKNNDSEAAARNDSLAAAFYST